jgi:hypothetical protein
MRKVVKLNKKQRLEFARLFAGSLVLLSDFGLDNVDIDNDSIEIIEKEKAKIAGKLLKNDPVFSSTKEIFEFVTKTSKTTRQ